MSTPTIPGLSPAVSARLVARAEEENTDVGQLLDALVDRALDLPEVYVFDGGGDRLVEVAHSAGTLGVFYPAEQDEEGDGYADPAAQERERAELETLLRDAGLKVDVVLRDFEVGRGAQGDPVTFLQIIAMVGAAITALGGAVAAPAAAINQWSTAAPKVREWLERRRRARGAVTLELVKEWCLEDARQRVQRPDELVPSFVSGHRGSAFTTSMDTQAVGPYCVIVQVPERSATFVYVTDEVGKILNFFEAPGPGEDDLIAEENR